MSLKFDRVLLLSPHTDDAEFGCGGSIARFIEEGKEVYYVAFSAAEQSVPLGMPSDTLRIEVKEATKELGIASGNLIVLNYEVRQFPSRRQDILEDMIRLKRELQPHLILLPSTFDTHQDHEVIAIEGFRAFKQSSMLGYEVPWNNLSFNTSSFIRLGKNHIEKKIEAIAHYQSQANRPYFTPEYIKSLSRVRGVQIGCEFAEAFELIRFVI